MILINSIPNSSDDISFLEERKSEENSGVEFPGTSLEPYVGSSLTMEDHDFDNKVVIVEISSPKFAYKYEDKGRV